MFFRTHKEKKDLHEKDSREYAQIKSIINTCATITFSPQGDVIDASQMFLDCVGYTLDEIVGQHHRLFCPEELVRDPQYAAFWTSLGNGYATRGTYLRKTKTGEDIWLEATYIPVHEDGEVTHVIKIANDISKQHEKSLESSAIVNAVERSNAVIDFTADGVIIAANSNFLQAMGYSNFEEINGKHHKIFCDNEFYVNNPDFWAKLAKGQVQNGLFKRLSKSGNAVWIEATYNPVFDHNGDIIKVTKIASDITQRIEKQDSIQKAAEVAHSTSTETAQVSVKGASILRELLENYKKISDSIVSSSMHTEKLIEQSAEISNIVVTINSIASQTNLLALNAAIEAARAGEHGRGFAVVSDEVRTLAASTTRSTDEINSMVERNNQLVSQVKNSMELVAVESDKSSGLINEASGIVNEILEGADYVSQVVSELLDSSHT